MSPRPAPIAFFAFNRPTHTARALAALAANPEATETELHIFIDGPRNAGDVQLVEDVKQIARQTRGFRSIEVFASPQNQGLFVSITSGVSRIIAEKGRVIVVEDDILVSPYFLAYINDALDRYASDPRVGSIHAYAPPIPKLPEFYFLRGADCWGWATWDDRWALFRDDPSKLLRDIVSNGLLGAFCSSHGTSSLLLLLRRVRGKNQSWAILWHASLFLAGRLTLHPGATFVDNIGNDGSGEHAANSDLYATPLIPQYDGLPVDLSVNENTHAACALGSFLDNIAIGQNGTFRHRLISFYAKLSAHIQAVLP